MPLVSVLIPTFNRQETIGRAVSSVLKQTHQELECIVIDDASTDKTLALLAAIDDPRVKVISLSENRGVSFARNKGFSQAKGEAIALLDSDDEWLEDKLERQLPLLEKYPLVHGEEIWVRNGKRVNQKKVHRKEGGRIFERCLHLCLISPSATLMTRELYRKMNGFREDYPVCEDYELWLRVTHGHEVGFISEPVITKYGGHEDQLSAKYKAMDYWRVKAMDEISHSLSLTEEELKALREVLLKKCDILIQGYLKHGNLENIPFIEDVRERHLQV